MGFATICWQQDKLDMDIAFTANYHKDRTLCTQAEANQNIRQYKVGNAVINKLCALRQSSNNVLKFLSDVIKS